MYGVPDASTLRSWPFFSPRHYLNNTSPRRRVSGHQLAMTRPGRYEDGEDNPIEKGRSVFRQ